MIKKQIREDSRVVTGTLGRKIGANMKKDPRKLAKLLARFMDNASEALFSNNPGIRVPRTPDIENAWFDAVGVGRQEVVDAISQYNEVFPSKFKVKQAFVARIRPVPVLLFIAQRKYADMRKEKERQLCMDCLIVIPYSIAQRRSWPHAHGPKFERVMQYTVNNLSRKFLLKQHGTVWAALQAKVEFVHKQARYQKLINSDDDEPMFDYLQVIDNRVRGFTNNVAEQFHDNFKNNRYLNPSDESDTELGVKEQRSNVSADVERVVVNAASRLRSDEPNRKAIRAHASAASVQPSDLLAAIRSIADEEVDRATELFRLVITIFIVDLGGQVTDICSSKFILSAMRAYGKSHTQEPNVLALKRLLGEILDDRSETYYRTKRAATKSGFRRAMYLYLVTHIQETVCG